MTNQANPAASTAIDPTKAIRPPLRGIRRTCVGWPGRFRGCARPAMGLVGRKGGLRPRFGPDVHDQVFEVQIVIDRRALVFLGAGKDRRLSIRLRRLRRA